MHLVQNNNNCLKTVFSNFHTYKNYIELPNQIERTIFIKTIEKNGVRHKKSSKHHFYYYTDFIINGEVISSGEK